MKPGAWSYAIAAHVMSSNKSTIFQSHDRAYLGRRDDMEKLFCNDIPKHVDEVVNPKAKFVYGGLDCKSGDYEICTQEIKVVPEDKNNQADVKLMRADGSDGTGEGTLFEVATKMEYKMLNGEGPLYGK